MNKIIIMTNLWEMFELDVDSGSQSCADVGRAGRDEAVVRVPHELPTLQIHLLLHLEELM